MFVGCTTVNIPPRGAERRCDFVDIRPRMFNLDDDLRNGCRIYYSISLTDAKRLFKNEFPNVSEDELVINGRHFDYEWDWDHPSTLR